MAAAAAAVRGIGHDCVHILTRSVTRGELTQCSVEEPHTEKISDEDPQRSFRTP